MPFCIKKKKIEYEPLNVEKVFERVEQSNLDRCPETWR